MRALSISELGWAGPQSERERNRLLWIQVMYRLISLVLGARRLSAQGSALLTGCTHCQVAPGCVAKVTTKGDEHMLTLMTLLPLQRKPGRFLLWYVYVNLGIFLAAWGWVIHQSAGFVPRNEKTLCARSCNARSQDGAGLGLSSAFPGHKPWTGTWRPLPSENMARCNAARFCSQT